MSKYLNIMAGPSAYQYIQNNGLKAEDFSWVVGASGGPKWFILYHLNRYLYGEFFKNFNGIVNTLGSSAGAWQLACLGMKNPVAALDRLLERYSSESYGNKPDRNLITQKAYQMMEYVLGAHGAEEIVFNHQVKNHVIVARAKHWCASEKVGLQSLGLASSFLLNLVKRDWLSLMFERCIFSADHSKQTMKFPGFNTQQYDLNVNNLKQVLMATGSIPLVLWGQDGIGGANPGRYRDGGIIDYHFDLPFYQTQKLVLYPHFTEKPIAGWFDKKIYWRKIPQQHYDNVVMLTPSASLVESLPFKKISDRNDFKRLSDNERQNYWQKVIESGQYLAEAFSEWCQHFRLEDVQPLKC